MKYRIFLFLIFHCFENKVLALIPSSKIQMKVQKIQQRATCGQVVLHPGVGTNIYACYEVKYLIQFFGTISVGVLYLVSNAKKLGSLGSSISMHQVCCAVS